MESTPASPVPASAPAAANWQEAAVFQAMSLRNQINGGLSWFYIIAGVTTLNSMLYRAGATITFVVGLAASQFVDGLSTALAAEYGDITGTVISGLGLVLSLALAGFFLLAGWLSRRRHRWAVLVGLFFYALDTLLVLAFADWVGAAFHGLALVGLGRAWLSMGTLRKLEAAHGTGDIAAVQGLVLASGGAAPRPPAEPVMVPRLLEPVSAAVTPASFLLEPYTWLMVVPIGLLGLTAALALAVDFNLFFILMALALIAFAAYYTWTVLTRRIEIGNDGVRYWAGRQSLFFPWTEITAVKIERPQKQITFWQGQRPRRIHEIGLPREELARVRDSLSQQLAARRIPLR